MSAPHGEAHSWRYGHSRIAAFIVLEVLLFVLAGFGVLVYLMNSTDSRTAAMALPIALLISAILAPIILFVTTQLIAAFRTRITLGNGTLKLVVPTWRGIYGLLPMRSYALRSDDILGVDIRQEMRRGRKGLVSAYLAFSLRTKPYKRIMVCTTSHKPGDLNADEIARAIAAFSGQVVRDCGVVLPRKEFFVRPWREFSSEPWPE